MRIPLTRGKFAIVDPEDYAFLMQWRWYYHKGRQSEQGYADTYIYVKGTRKRITMHGIILERMGFKDFVQPDHINRNRLDNRKCNLRPATISQSNCNRDKPKNNTSGYKGVWFDKCRGKWRTDIRINKKKISLGYHNDPREAARVYNEAALKYHGEFAVLNEISQ